MDDRFSTYLLKEYPHWQALLHENQGYLGRLVIWCRRFDAEDLADASIEEQRELFEILRSARELLQAAFQPDWFNYAFLGNAAPHLHCHLVPRYKTRRQFAGTVFEDKLYGHPYRTDHLFVTSPELLAAVKAELMARL